ncbi:MAG: hypothetical protein ACFC1C_04180 [Candidatus Malihini olakiniferum]
MSKYLNVTVTVGIIYNAQRKFLFPLALRASIGEYLEDSRKKVELGEIAEQTLIRELREESRIEEMSPKELNSKIVKTEKHFITLTIARGGVGSILWT